MQSFQVRKQLGELRVIEIAVREAYRIDGIKRIAPQQASQPLRPVRLGAVVEKAPRYVELVIVVEAAFMARDCFDRPRLKPCPEDQPAKPQAQERRQEQQRPQREAEQPPCGPR